MGPVGYILWFALPWCHYGLLECTKYTLSPKHYYALIYNNALIAVEHSTRRSLLLLDDQSMQLAGLVRTGISPPIRFTRTWPSTAPIWANITEADPGKASAIKHKIVQRSAQSTTTVDTGLRREEVGGIIIGVCVGLILLVVLFSCCRRRRRSWSSDTESDRSVPHVQPTPQPPAPTHPRPPKAARVATRDPVSSNTTSRPPSMLEKPPYVPATPAKTQRPHGIIPTLANDAYDKAKYKSIAKTKDGRRYAEGHTGKTTDKPRAVGWAHPVRRDLPTEGINTLQD